MWKLFRRTSLLPLLQRLTSYRRTLVGDWNADFLDRISGVCAALRCNYDADGINIDPGYEDVAFVVDVPNGEWYYWHADFSAFVKILGAPRLADSLDYTFGSCLINTSTNQLICVSDVWMYEGNCIYGMNYCTVRSVYANNLNRRMFGNSSIGGSGKYLFAGVSKLTEGEVVTAFKNY